MNRMIFTNMMQFMSQPYAKRPTPSDSIYLLEILRFVSCIGVILYHYQHFITYRGDTYDSKALPMQTFFSWFYQNGDSGVRVFWCLSGIVFAHVYQTALLERTISASEFVWRRFARLYPLHLLTLVVVAILQWLFAATSNMPYFIYQFNNIKHFALNMMFANYWGFQDGTSFNGPVWSVSIELIAYSIFLILAIFVRKLPHIFHSAPLLIVLWTGVLWYCLSRSLTSSDFILDCISLFMIGMILYTAWMILPNFVVLTTIVYLIISYHKNDFVSRNLEVLEIPFTSLMIAVFIALLHFSPLFSRLKTGRLLSTSLGKITYGMYMIHFPIQLLMVLFSENLVGLDFVSLPVLLSFLGLTIGLSYVCYSFFEFPIQRALRKWFINLRA